MKHKPLLGWAVAAALEKNVKAKIVELANSFPCPVRAHDRDGWTPLHRAVSMGIAR